MRLLIKKAKESELEAKALKECTFSPNLVSDPRHRRRVDHSRDRLESAMYERGSKWEQQRQWKLDGARASQEQIPDECTFRPRTTQYKPKAAQNYPRELQENQCQRDALANYYYRMDRARSKSSNKMPKRVSSRLQNDDAIYGGNSNDQQSAERDHKTRYAHDRMADASGHFDEDDYIEDSLHNGGMQNQAARHYDQCGYGYD